MRSRCEVLGDKRQDDVERWMGPWSVQKNVDGHQTDLLFRDFKYEVCPT
jgi:hypothetical protein